MRPIAYFSRRYRLSASHRLFLPSMTEEQNMQTFGKCANPFGHGHNYTIEVTVAGPVDSVTGMVVDLVAMDGVAKREVIERWDHTNLNDDPHFREGLVPSTENFAAEVERVLRRGMEALAQQSKGSFQLSKIHIEETTNNSFDMVSNQDKRKW